MRLSGLRWALSIVVAGTATGCVVHQSEQAPPPSGPSTFAESITVTATPDLIAQDGRSQSSIGLRVFDANGQPVGAVPIRVDILVADSTGKLALADYGTLSIKTIVTAADGRASTMYTAPPPSAVQASRTVTIQATAIGSDAAAAIPFSTAIRLVPPGVILPPAETPNAAFTISPTTALANTPLQFNASTSCGGAPVSGACQSTSQIAAYSWDFGDGSSGSGRTATHTYTIANSYSVTLTVTNDRGVSASTTQAVMVGAASMPAAAFAFSPVRPGTGDPVFFTAAASAAGPGHTIVSYQWSYGDGDTAVGQSPTHRYSSAATYVVTLTVTDEANQSASISQNVTILGSAGPTAITR